MSLCFQCLFLLFHIIGLKFARRIDLPRYASKSRPLSLLEAERVFSHKLNQAFENAAAQEASAQAKRPSDGSTTSTVTTLDEESSSTTTTSTTSTNVDENEEARKKRETIFQEEQMKRYLKAMKPSVQAYICLQLSIDLSFLVPGLTVDFGVLGGVRRDLSNKCWTVTAEVGLGFSWGFEVYGYGLGLGASVTGSLDLSEMPEEAVRRDNITRTWHFAPEGSDPRRCHTSAFWTLALTYIENEYVRAYHRPEVRERITKITESREYLDRKEEFAKAYGAFVDGDFKAMKLKRSPFMRTFMQSGFSTGLSRALGDSSVNSSALDDILSASEKAEGFKYVQTPLGIRNRSRTESFDDGIAEDRKADRMNEDYLNLDILANEVGHWRRPKVLSKRGATSEHLMEPAYAMSRAMRNFVSLLPAYADQVLNRLIDGSGQWHGFDSELEIAVFKNKNLKRLRETDGRHLARWPSIPDFESVKSDTEDKLVGISYKKSGTDDRVVNFAKAMRLSEHSSGFRFWKEIAISASNLLIRVVADVKALFSAALANNPTWDGSCESLPTSFRVHDGLDSDLLLSHTWVSKRAQPKNRILFAKSSGDNRPLKGAPDLRVCDAKTGCVNGSGTVIYPHLWCVLAEKGRDATNIELEIVRDIALFASQACVGVVHEEVELKEGDEISKGYKVRNDGRFIGELVGEQKVSDFEWTGDAEADRALAIEQGFKVRIKNMEQRPDCERVVLPKSFRRIFPSFVKLAQELVSRMEEILFRINMCLEEAHNVYRITSSFRDKDAWRAEPRQCLTDEQKTSYTKEKASDAIRLVRWFLFQLGAEDPRKCTACEYDWDALPLARYELDALRDNKKHFAPAANSMALDFVSAFGYGPAETVFENHPNVVEIVEDTNKFRWGVANLFVLEGFMWLRFPSVKEALFHIADPHDRLVRELEKKLIRPPIEYTNGRTFTAQLSANGFCTPNSAPIVVARTSQTTRQSWSNQVRYEVCWTGRLRPGSFFIQVARCSGSLDGESEDPQSYIDWRIRFQSMLFGGDIFKTPEAGIFGTALTSADGALSAALTSAAALGGGFMSYNILDKLAPRVMENPVVGSLLMLSGAALPGFAVLAASAAVVTSHSFEQACHRFLHHMAANGIVAAPGQDPYGFQFSPILVVHGTVVHRVREQALVRGARWGEITQITQRQRRVVLHLENWNIASLNVPVFGAGKLSIVGRFEFDFDLTPWYEAVKNKELKHENEVRIAKCMECLSDPRNEAFCDWRIPLGSEWTPERDQCVPNTVEEQAECTNPIGVTDLNGRDLLAVWHAPGNTSTCQTITYVGANQEIKASRSMHQFFRRH